MLTVSAFLENYEITQKTFLLRTLKVTCVTLSLNSQSFRMLSIDFTLASTVEHSGLHRNAFIQKHRVYFKSQ